MKKFRSAIIKSSVAAVLAAWIVLLGLHVVRADLQSSWLSTNDPGIQKLTDLPPNIPPQQSNRDCTQLSYLVTNPTTGLQTFASDCFVDSVLGTMQLNGSPVMFGSTALPLIGYGNYSYLVQPIPNQALTLSLSGSPLLGLYAHFYTNLRQHLTENRDGITGALTSYTVNKIPDFQLRDKNNTMININPDSISYSSNGAWMLVDAYNRGFLRINLATFDVIPFGQTLNNGPSDYSSHQGTTAISDDGRYITVASNEYSYFKVYDMSTCSGTVSNDYVQHANCQYRDYWPALAAKISGYRIVYKARFTDDDNINITAVYNWQSGSSFSAATYTVTAPGKTNSAIGYLALGDSYISGQGEFVYKDGTDTANNPCHLSPLSYPFTIGAGLFNQYQSVACSGAVTNDVTNTSRDYTGQVQDKIKKESRDVNSILSSFDPGYVGQIEFVKKYQPKAITISIGGNNIAFSKMLSSCVTPERGSIPAVADSITCYDSYDDRLEVAEAIGSVFSDLQKTYQAIISADPGVRLYVVGYPQVAVEGNCADNVRLSADEIQFSQQLIAYLDWTIERAANSVGARYVDTQQALAGSRLCETTSRNIAVNGVTAGNDVSVLGQKVIGNESFHPNILGHQLIGQKILALTNNLKQPMPAADASISRPKLTDPLALALLGNRQYSGNPPPQIAGADNNMMTDLLTRGSTTPLTVNGTQHALKSNTSYQVVLHSDPINLGMVTTNANGDINTQITLPASMPAGFHTLHISGKNMADQTIDIYEIIYVAASITDYDGDGIPNSADQCLIVPLSGHDADQDGIDDACDPLIGDPPANKYPYRASLLDNTIFIVNPNSN